MAHRRSSRPSPSVQVACGDADRRVQEEPATVAPQRHLLPFDPQDAFEGFSVTVKVATQSLAPSVRRVPDVGQVGALVGILAPDDLIALIAEQLTDLPGLLGMELRHEREVRSG